MCCIPDARAGRAFPLHQCHGRDSGNPCGSSDKTKVDKHLNMGLYWCQPSLLLPKNLQRSTISTTFGVGAFA